MLWTTRDGRELNISDMSESHLINAIRYIEEVDFVLIKRMGGGHGEDIWYDEEEINLKPQYNEMRKELKRRNK